MSLLLLSMYSAFLVVDCLLAVVALARVLPADRRAGLFLFFAATSAALTVVGSFLADVGAIGTILWQALQGLPTDVWWYGYGQGALVVLQVAPVAHAVTLVAAAYALFKLTGTLLVEPEGD